MDHPRRDAARFVAIIAASVVLGGAIAAGQSIVLDPDGSPAASFSGDVQGQNLVGAPAINWDFEAGPVGANKRIPGWETSAWYLDHDATRGTVSGDYAYGEESCCDHDDSGSGSGVNTYDLYKRFSGEFGNEPLTVSVEAEVFGDVDGVGTCSAGNAYVGEDDARIILNAYDSSGNLINTKWGEWGVWHASRQGYSGDGDASSRDVHDYVTLWANWTAPAGTKMIEVDLHAGERTDSCGTFAAKGGGNSAVYFDDFNFETDAEGWKDLGGQTQYAQFDTLEVMTHADIEGNIDMSNNYIDNKQGLWSSYLTTTQSSVEGGSLINVYENVDTNDGTYSRNDANTVTVQRSGTYRISYQVNVHRTGSSARNVMRTYLQIGGSNYVDRSATACYIRTNGGGDECTNSATVMLDLSSGDTVEVYTHEERGGETGNDVEHARINMEYLG